MPSSTSPNRADALGVAPSREQFRRYVWFAGIWLAIYLLLPQDFMPYWYAVLGWVSTIWALRVARRLAPGVRSVATLVVVAAMVSLTGGIVRSIDSMVTGVEYPFPSPADALTVLAYVMFLVAIVTIVHRRVRRFTLDPLLDAILGGLAVATVQWSLVLLPYLRTADATFAAKAVNVAFAGLSLLLVVAAVLALVSGSSRSTSNRLLAAGLLSTFALDAIATLVTSGRLPDVARLYGAPFLIIFGAAGLLHPTVVDLTSRPFDDRMARSLTARRIGVLAGALITPPVLLVIGIVRGDTQSLVLPAVSSLLLAPLVVTRLGRLVHQNQELASLEAALRGIGEQLVGAETSGDVIQVVTEGARRILGDRFMRGGLVVEADEDERTSDDVTHAAFDALGKLLGSGTRPRTGEIVPLPEFDDGGSEWMVGIVDAEQGRSAGLVLATNGPLGADERNTVVQLCREAAIALRAVERTEQQVRQRSEDRFASLIENSSDIVAVLDRRMAITYVSPVAQRLLGYPLDYYLDMDAMALVHPDDATVGEGILDQMRAGSREPLELRLRHLAGTFHWFEVVGVDLTDDPNIGGYLLNLREISDRKAAEEQLVLSEARFKALVQHSTDMVVVLDDDGIIRYSSPSVSDVLGPLPDQLLGKSVESAFTDSDIDWHNELRTHAGQPHLQLVEFRFRRGEDVRTIETSITDLRSEPAVGGFVLNARDVTERRSMEQRLRYQATHDELTGLANRPHVVEDLDGILGRNSGSTTVAAIAVGLDDFKDVNDSLGHVFGDNLLIAVAERLKGLLSFGDVAARVGGDEYVVVVERSHGENHVTELADQILAAIALPYLIDGRELTITASAGIVFDHDRTNTGEILLRNADTAMYRSKSLGKRQVVVFEPQMHAASYDRLELRADLARAIAGNQFVAHYQPIVDIHTRRITGAEALIRWDHPTRGMLGPNLFIPLAEESGMIGALGEWILRRACTDVAAWRRQFGRLIEDFTISVNLSVHQLHDEYIVSTVEEILAYSGLPAQRLVLEVTESTLITDNDRTSAIMSQLRSLGARLAVDDFGTGYSSLGYIQQFEFDILKIDKSFVDGLDVTTNQQIVTAVIDLARQLGVRTVAEGIETEPNVATLQRLGCDLGQGYLFSRPVSEAAFRELLAEDRQKDSAQESPPEDGVHAKLS